MKPASRSVTATVLVVCRSLCVKKKNTPPKRTGHKRPNMACFKKGPGCRIPVNGLQVPDPVRATDVSLEPEGWKISLVEKKRGEEGSLQSGRDVIRSLIRARCEEQSRFHTARSLAARDIPAFFPPSPPQRLSAQTATYLQERLKQVDFKALRARTSDWRSSCIERWRVFTAQVDGWIWRYHIGQVPDGFHCCGW